MADCLLIYSWLAGFGFNYIMKLNSAILSMYSILVSGQTYKIIYIYIYTHIIYIHIYYIYTHFPYNIDHGLADTINVWI